MIEKPGEPNAKLPRFHFCAGDSLQNEPSEPMFFESFRAHYGRAPYFELTTPSA